MHPSTLTPQSITEYILFCPEHSIVICRQCKYAIAPGERIKRHFQSLHQAISLQTRKEIIVYCSTLRLLPLEEVITPEPSNGPIEGLELFSKGWKCIYKNCSGYLSSTESLESMKIHCRIHGWKIHDEPMWEKCAMQTFFQGVHRKYFEVEIEKQRRFDLNILLDSMLREVDEQDEEYNHTLNHVTRSHIVTKSPWLLRTDWEKKFEGKDMKTLIKLTEIPDKNEGEILRLWESGSRFIHRCWKGAEDISNRGWNLILFWLNSSNREKANVIPFRLTTQEKTVVKYVIIWKRFNG